MHWPIFNEDEHGDLEISYGFLDEDEEKLDSEKQKEAFRDNRQTFIEEQGIDLINAAKMLPASYLSEIDFEDFDLDFEEDENIINDLESS